MDTKSKKWKVTVSLLSFFLGCSFLLSGAYNLVAMAVREEGDGIATAYQKDYQQTSWFRSEICNYLEDFLGVALDGPVRNHTWYDYNFYDEARENESVIEQKAWAESSNWYDEEEEQPTQEEKDWYVRQAQRLIEGLKNDQNLLYRITVDGTVKATNAEEVTLSDGTTQLPPEYNFLLHFDGKKATVTKDDIELDLYGDGYYREGDWYLPGYQNLTADKDTARVTVTIAVRKEPLYYIQKSYNGRKTQWQGNSIYDIALGFQHLQQRFLSGGAALLVGLVLLIPAIVWRKEKRQGDRAVAAVTGRVWLEVKLLLLIGVLVTTVIFRLVDTGIWQYETSVALGDISAEMVTYAATNWAYFDGNYQWLIRDFFFYRNGSEWLLLLLFWLIYGFINDLRYNRKATRNSFCARAAAVFRTSNLKLPLQKRAIHRLGILTAAGILAALFMGTLFGGILGHVGFGMLWGAAMGVLWLLFLWAYAKQTRRIFTDTELLTDRITAVRDGNLDQQPDFPPDSDLQEASRELDDIRSGLQRSLDEQIKTERMKVELITNVSHDIKTPLTSIVSYVDLLKQEENLPDAVRDYVEVIDRKSQRLKSMVLDVFEVSKAASGQLPVDIKQLDLVKLLRQTLADMEERIASSSVTVKPEIPETPALICADGQRLYRVFQNLLANALQYSLEGSRVYVTLQVAEGVASASVRNTSKQELPQGVDFTERFFRGDQTRTEEGSGLGLSIARSFTEACGGRFRVENISDLFVATVEFSLDALHGERRISSSEPATNKDIYLQDLDDSRGQGGI